jgi:pyruvate/2-oxoglutarate dehydrogenase complex dihydrolipoamide dehydrogenase (E3) component
VARTARAVNNGVTMPTPLLLPADEHNAELLANAHPPDWRNPTPSGTYNLVVIGGGTAGIISALGAAGLGGKVALIERQLLGGDCLNVGCVPSKALLRAARAVEDVRSASQFGVHVPGEASIDFATVMERMRRVRAGISHHDSAARFTKLGVDVYLGEARFVDRHALEVAGQRLDFRRCIIATGGRAAIPKIEGLEDAGYLTNETVFSLTALPQRLLIIGGGPIGCELAQAFRRFGSEVIIVHRAAQLLEKEEPSAAALVQAQLVREGVRVIIGAQVRRVERTMVRAVSRMRATMERDGTFEMVECDAILVAAGRTPNVDNLNLAAAGVTANERGVEVDDFLRTKNPHVLAAGDVAGGPQFTHAADAMARVCLQNAFFFGRKRLSQLVIPRTTYTDPEIASIGLTAAQCLQRGLAIDTLREELAHVDRAILDGEENGFALVHCGRGTGKVVGATIVARHAGEMIGELSLLMTSKQSLGALASTIHCYPTQVEVLKRIADQYNRTRLNPRVAGWLRWLLRSR